MQLIRFEERVYKYPCSQDFIGYLIIQLDTRDMQDIMLIKSSLDENSFKIIDFKKGIIEILDYNIFTSLRMRREDKVDACHRLWDQMHLILTELRDTPTHSKRFALQNYRTILQDIDFETRLKSLLSKRYNVMQKYIKELTEEEIEVLGLNVNYAEFSLNDFNAIVHKEKDSPCIDGEVIATLESAYSQGIE
ncbi:hypothetical protein N8506_00385 [Synechococcus sp. AH-601-N23]|nr:hypothetical protein [Synechococcus sp. AH-601-N23]